MRTLGPGTEVAGYRIEHRIGAGGMGSVYLARHPRLPRRDALKVLSRGADAEFRARFLREAELAGRLDHPNIVAIYDCGSDGEMLWIAMQFVAGYDAAKLVKQQGGLPAERAVAIVRGAARGLDEAHRAGMLHRDVKPANILIEPGSTENGASSADRVLVTDFGIARATTESGGLTAAGKVLATLAFAAPEQISGGQLDERTDVYALGGTLYQLLTGAVPFPRETAAAVMHAHLSATRPRPSSIDPAIPSGLDTVIARAMAIDPDERYRSCGELAEAAEAALRGEIAAPKRRHRRIPALIAALVAVAALAAAIGVGMHDRTPADTSNGAAPSTTTAGSPWGSYGFITDTFRELLPATPSGRGFGDLRCAASDNSNRAVAIDAVLDQPRLTCSGEDLALWVTCNTDRSPMAALETTDATEGSETWSRSTGTGHIAWKSFDSDGKSRGQLDIQFDGARAFCKMRATGASSGRALYDKWWASAPI